MTVAQLDHAIDGRVTYRDGFARALQPAELRYDWESLGGADAAWDFYDGAHPLSALRPEQAIPADWLQRETRVQTWTGLDLIGLLVSTPTPGTYGLEMKHSVGGPVLFTRDGSGRSSRWRTKRP